MSSSLDATKLDHRIHGVIRAVKERFRYSSANYADKSWVFRVARASDDVQETLERALQDTAAEKLPLENADFLMWCEPTDACGGELRDNQLMNGLYSAYAVAIALNEGVDWVQDQIARLEDKISSLEERGTDRAEERAAELTDLKEELEGIADTMEHNQSDGAMAMLEALENGDLEAVQRVLDDGALQLDIGEE